MPGSVEAEHVRGGPVPDLPKPASSSVESVRGRGSRERAPEVVFLVAGEGPLRGELQGRIDRENLPVRLLGNRADVGDLLGVARALVVPSR